MDGWMDGWIDFKRMIFGSFWVCLKMVAAPQ